MNFHITNIYNMLGAATMADEGVAQVAKTLGFKEMGIPRRHFHDDYWNSMSHHLDGIIAPLFNDDVVVFQYPSWNGTDYDREFINKIRLYAGTKLIIFVHDIQKIMFDSEQQVMDWEIAMLNRADLLILPSERMRECILKNGLKSDIPVIYQKIWEMPGYPVYTQHLHYKKMYFTGNIKRFPFLREYHGKTCIEYFDGKQPENEHDGSYIWRGYMPPKQLMKELSTGGYGLVWSDEATFERYYSMNQPHKLGFYLTAGIPVIVRKGGVHSEWITEKGYGFAVDSLEEADNLVQRTTDEEYYEMTAAISHFQQMSVNGIYTKKLLIDAVAQVLEN